MREVTFFWKLNRVEHLDIGSVVKIFRRIEFLSYVKRVPKDVRCLMKCHFADGKGPEDIDDLYFLDYLETIVKPDSPDEPYILMVRFKHSLTNLNARTNGTSAVPNECFLDGEGLRYTIQGPKLKLRLFSGLARLIAKPDRVSARSIHTSLGNNNGTLSSRQMKLAKFAYDKGYFEIPKRTRISDLADELGLARATVSEHMAKIESTVMDDMFSSLNGVYLSPESIRESIETMVIEARDIGFSDTDGFREMMRNMRVNLEDELPAQELYLQKLHRSDDELIQASMEEHRHNLSHIDEILRSKESPTATI
ncbi:MAG: hypothetical protein DWC09_08075 [Candidatus Poseidoniales archaeon]|nr:MAG: hypothetical protein DWC09_08075 [Candidatus Poseidoniales archaeon]